MKKLTTLFSFLCLTVALTVSASALNYDIDGPGDPEYGKATSVEIVHPADGGAMKNEDVSKNAALVPPTFGSPTAYTLNTGTPLTPNLAPGYMMGEGAIINGNAGITVAPPDFGSITFGGTSNGTTVAPSTSISSTSVPSTSVSNTSSPSTGFTDVTSDLYYKGDYLATLKIPSIDVNVKVYEGTSSSVLAKGAGHFTDTSIWAGNVGIAGHNRGANCYFGDIHTLSMGDKIKLTTKLGTRTYEVTSVSKVSETDRSALATSTQNIITLYTCVRDQRDQRWCVQGVEVR